VINKCVFPAAGYGTRFLPVTKSVPKELLPILSRPLIEYAVEEAISAGIQDQYFIISRYKESIREYFQNTNQINEVLNNSTNADLLKRTNEIIDRCKFTYINQDEMLGLGHAILMAKNYIGDNPFAVLLPDDLCYNKEESVLAQMTHISELYPDKSIVAVEEVSQDQVQNYGIIKGQPINSSKDIFNVSEMIEKPSKENAPSNMAIIGRYILQPEIFRLIESVDPDSNGEIQITNALNKLCISGKVLAYKFSGIRMDCGRVDGYIDANIFFRDNH